MAPLTVIAYELHDVSVSHKNKRYTVEMSVTLAAAASDSYSAFTDFDSLPRIHGAVQKAETTLDEQGNTRLATLLRVCVSFYCRALQQEQLMMLTPISDGVGSVLAIVIPEKSDFRYGQAHWSFADHDGQTRLLFSAEMEPDFWVPPLIGPWLIQRRLRSEAIETSAGLEKLALEKAASRAEKQDQK